MNSIEARWRKETPLTLVALALSETFGFDEKTAFAVAKVSLNTLADNVSEKMVDAALTGPAMRSLKDGIAAAIRAAGEENDGKN